MPPKKGAKAAAAAAAHAASRHKASTVELSGAHEARVRELLQSLELASTAASGGGDGTVTEADVADVYDALLAHGFRVDQARAALTATAPALTVDAALDWLCLHVDASELPPRFAGGVRARAASRAAGVKLVAAAEQGATRPAARRTDVTALVLPHAPLAARRDDGAVAAEAARDKTRALMQRYMEEESGSGSEAGGSGASSVVEDWEVWGDPREVERRKAARARAAVPPAVRRVQVLQEWAVARAEAARAKAAADKGRQRVVGQLIAELKREAAALGLGDADLELGGEEAGRGDGVRPAEAADAAGGSDWGGGGDASGNEASAWEEDAGPSGGGSGGRRAAPASSPSSSMSGDDALDGGGMEMFDDAGGGVTWEASALGPKTIDDLLKPWGFDDAGGGGKRRERGGGGKPVPVARDPPKPPKALLQSLCQRRGLPAPRFEKRPPGGLRLECAGSRYAVSVAAGPPPRGSKGGKKGAPAPRERLFHLAEVDDGWNTIQDAQNAVATLALHELTSGAEAADAARSLPPPFDGLWLKWATSGAGSGGGGPVLEEAGDRAAFLRSVVGDGGGGGGAGGAGARAGGGRAGPGAGPADVLPAADNAGTQPATAAPAPPKPPSARDEAESERAARALAAFEASADGRRWLALRAALPAAAIREPLLAALEAGDVVVVGGDTGCGKTTQVPQFLLEAATRRGAFAATSIVVTQPRRLAATSVAERVAAERGEPPPGAPGARVGYHVRLDAARTKDTHLLFCTTGILLRRLATEPDLASVSHVVVDEVHERTLQGDFLMTLLRDIVGRRRAAGAPLKVVLMSATLDARLFSDYFGGCASLAAGGRTFPVDHYFLEDAYEATGYRLAADARAALRGGGGGADRRRLERGAGSKAALVRTGWGDDADDGPPLNKHYDATRYDGYSMATKRNLGRVDETAVDYELLEELVEHIDAVAAEAAGCGPDSPDDGAVLVFLPGLAEITAVYDRLATTPAAREGRRLLLPLHSSISGADQKRVFARPPPGVRKVVLATNIAETSLTIDDIVYVVDAAKVKERRHDAGRGMSLLVEDFVSRASALQRRGRAGRVRPGVCYTLVTRHRFETRLRPFQAPEMVRVPLEELVLQIHLLSLGPAGAFLARTLEPPPAKAVDGALASLVAVGALTPDERLTPLGHHLAALPVDARVGKLLLLGACLGCLGPALTVGATLAYRSPFAAPFDQQDAVNRVKQAMAAPGAGGVAAGQQSDHLLMVAAYDAWAAAVCAGGRRGGAAAARAGMLSQQTLEMLRDMRAQFADMLADIGFVDTRGGGRGGGAGVAWTDDPRAPHNAHASSPAVIKAVLCAALYPNVAVMDGLGGSARPGWHDGGGPVALHPSSVNHPLHGRAYAAPYMVYLEKVRTSKTFLRDTTVVSPMALLLFGGDLEVHHGDGLVTVDGWLRVRAAGPTAVLVKKLRAALDDMLAARVRGGGRGRGGRGDCGDGDGRGGREGDAVLIATLVGLLEDDAAQAAAGSVAV